MADAGPLNVQFVCSRNQWRSPTAEHVWKNHSGVSVRSAGVSGSARRRLTVADLRWADLILVMEEKHRSRIRAEHRDEVRYKALHVLDIPDDYQFMQPELIELLRLKVAPFIQEATRA
ncbi:MAG: phosphotyrosine protein phosphatase [Hyphomonadaceae bacterium]|nr:phosphotyrosine protein phosphatase [Hyphomonadaceae bacterium]